MNRKDPRDIKTKQLGIRCTPEELQLIKEKSKKEGFNSHSSFILWLVKKYDSSGVMGSVALNKTPKPIKTHSTTEIKTEDQYPQSSV